MKKSFLQRDLSVAGVVLVIVGALAAGGVAYFGYRFYSAARTRAHLRASIPKLCEELSQQRQVLVSAINAYRQDLGFYPPDHAVGQNPLVIDAVTNALLYELAGTIYSASNDIFYANKLHGIRRVDARAFFNVESFRNSAKSPAAAKCFLKTSDLSATLAISEKPNDVYLAGFWPNWEGADPELWTQIDAGPWCYNSSTPSHNPGKYDLWIEVKTPLTNIICGNW